MGRNGIPTRTVARVVFVQEAEENGDPPHVACAVLVLVSEDPHGTLHTAPQQPGGVQDLRLPRDTASLLLRPLTVGQGQ
jgi:hypothetical protein